VLQDNKAISPHKGLYHKTKRGKRAGKHTKPTQANRHNNRGVQLSNLIQVPIIKKPQQSIHLPSILYTNCRCINTWKTEELKSYTEIHQPRLICLTETWLDKAKQQVINLDGYETHFANRKNRTGGGVCILSCSKLGATTIATYTTTTVSAIWILLQQGPFQPIIVGCFYHPPNADQSISLDYLASTIGQLTLKHPNAKYIIAGDFNRLPITNLCEQFGLSNIVNFPTRHDVTLDLILTDLTAYIDQVDKLAPLGTNDHCCIFHPVSMVRMKLDFVVIRIMETA
jgi:exonuclease III